MAKDGGIGVDDLADVYADLFVTYWNRSPSFLFDQPRLWHSDPNPVPETALWPTGGWNWLDPFRKQPTFGSEEKKVPDETMTGSRNPSSSNCGAPHLNERT